MNMSFVLHRQSTSQFNHTSATYCKAEFVLINKQLNMPGLVRKLWDVITNTAVSPDTWAQATHPPHLPHALEELAEDAVFRSLSTSAFHHILKMWRDNGGMTCITIATGTPDQLTLLHHAIQSPTNKGTTPLQRAVSPGREAR